MPSDAEGIAAVHVASWATTYSGLLPLEVIRGHTLGSRAAFWQRVLAEPARAADVMVAQQGGRIVGFASVGESRSSDVDLTHELYTLYTLAEIQGYGIGRSLFLAGAARAHASGAQSLYAWVLADNRLGCSFYERQRGVVVAERTEAFGGRTVRELAYGWNDLSELLDG